MKKINGAFLLCLMLTSCAVVPSTEERFDAALTSLEEGYWQETIVTLENDVHQEVLRVKTSKSDERVKTEMFQNQAWQEVATDSLIAQFCQGDLLVYVYQNFSEKEKDGMRTIGFEVPEGEYQLLEEAFDLSIEKVTGEMLINQEDKLLQIVFSISAVDGQYRLLLEMEDEK